MGMMIRPGQRLIIPGAQVYQPRAAAGGSFSGVLDGISNVAAAYSLRKLRSAYSGYAVRVRRSSDSAEQDIGFDGSGNFDSSAFSSFVGGGTGYVRTWYDQSGNGRDAGQATTGNQPQISSGINSKFCIYQPTGALGLSTATISIFPSKRGSIITLTQRTSESGNNVVAATFSAASPGFVLYSNTTTTSKYFDGTAQQTLASADPGTSIIQSLSREGDTTTKYWRLGSLINTWTQTNNQLAAGSLYIGTFSALSNGLIGYIADFIYFSATISTTDHNTIGNDMATYYGLSWTTVT